MHIKDSQRALEQFLKFDVYPFAFVANTCKQFAYFTFVEAYSQLWLDSSNPVCDVNGQDLYIQF